MIIKASHKLWQVQKHFHELFPFLRMEYTWTEENRKPIPIFLNRTFTETSEVDPEVLIVTEEFEKPMLFKHRFRNAFRLNVRIFKKVGKARWTEVPENEAENLSDINARCRRLLPDDEREVTV
jgi:hypothetical protein